MPAPLKTTLSDIALATGLSQATVSMILNDKSGMSFSEDTVRKVNEAAKELGYIRPGQKNKARKIFNGKTIAIFSPNVTSPYYATLIQSIEQAAYNENYNTFILTTYRDIDREIDALNMIKGTDISGVIFTMLPQASKLVEEINQTIPVTVIGDRNNTVRIDTIEVNNYAAGVLVAQHMIDLGHRHIAYISTTLDASNAPRVKRLLGIQDTFQKDCSGGTVLVKSRIVTPQDELNNLPVEYTVGYELAKECLSHKEITAFVAVNDMVAYGVMDALRSENYRIPEDYSVCGFDNIFPSQFSGLALTTVEHYILEKGHIAFEILQKKINHTNYDGSQANQITRVEYQNHLIIRGTTAPPERKHD